MTRSVLNAIVSYGLAADLPATPNTLSTVIFIATDTGALYVWNGTAWVRITALGTAGGDLSGTYPNPTVTQVHGSSTNDSASAGIVGEYISSTVLIGAAIALTTNVTADITSISLTAGDWDCWGTLALSNPGTTTVQFIGAACSSVSATFPTAPNGGANFTDNAVPAIAGLGYVGPVGMTRISNSGTATEYLVTIETFAVSTLSAYGFIGARRRR